MFADVLARFHENESERLMNPSRSQAAAPAGAAPSAPATPDAGEPTATPGGVSPRPLLQANAGASLHETTPAASVAPPPAAAARPAKAAVAKGPGLMLPPKNRPPALTPPALRPMRSVEPSLPQAVPSMDKMRSIEPTGGQPSLVKMESITSTDSSVRLPSAVPDLEKMESIQPTGRAEWPYSTAVELEICKRNIVVDLRDAALPCDSKIKPQMVIFQRRKGFSESDLRTVQRARGAYMKKRQREWLGFSLQKWGVAADVIKGELETFCQYMRRTFPKFSESKRPPNVILRTVKDFGF